MLVLRNLLAVLWYTLPLTAIAVIAIAAKFPPIIFLSLPALTCWVATAGLSVPRRLAPKGMWVLEQNLLNIHYVLEGVQKVD